MSRPPLLPFTSETAAQKARLAEDAWNTRDPATVAKAYTAGASPVSTTRRSKRASANTTGRLAVAPTITPR
jgi:nuclear transport factor 2 (NTF2) superfamily protein